LLFNFILFGMLTLKGSIESLSSGQRAAGIGKTVKDVRTAVNLVGIKS
jgi:hypothetical protein